MNAQESLISTSKPTTCLQNASITWEANGLPRSDTYDDIYFSATDPIAESQHVFIQGNDLETRMANTGNVPLVIGELGFGFGVNFLVSCERFCQLAPVNSRLHFLSCEIHPVLLKDLEKWFSLLPPSLQPFAELLLEQYPEQGKGLHRVMFCHQQRHITLDLLYDEANAAFAQLSMPAPGIDAWYLDGYAPSKNKAMWDDALCRIIASLSKPGSTLATYSVAGFVRENLQRAGFVLSKSTGFGNKRHMLTGLMPESTPMHENQHAYWSNPWSEEKSGVRHIGIIGAGLAGCATAHALAARGYCVSLIEKNDNCAGGASGNPRGIVHFNPGQQLNPANRFRLSAFRYAVRHYHNLAKHHAFSWLPCGLIQLASNSTELDEFKKLLSGHVYDPAFMSMINAGQASATSGVSINHDGLFFPDAGCLDPVALCQAWTSAENILPLYNRKVEKITFHQGQWQVNIIGQQGREEQKFDALVLCDNGESFRLIENNEYPVLFNHGQTDSFNQDDSLIESGVLKCVVRKKGYVIPWGENNKSALTVGGSFAPTEATLENSTSMREKNLQMLKEIAPTLYDSMQSVLTNEPAKISSRMGMRCSTPDYLPLAGPVEETLSTRAIFSDLQRNARKKILAKPGYCPGLYINIAHGSSGLVTTPLLGEYIASLVSRDGLPISNEEISAILPVRYLIRALKRQQGKGEKVKGETEKN